MLQAVLRTVTEILDSKKAAYSFIAALGASVLHIYFGLSVQDALLLVSPLGVATISEAHVDAARAKNSKSVPVSAAAAANAETTATVDVAPAPVIDDTKPTS